MSSSQKWTSRLPESTRTWLDGRRIEEVDCIVADIAGISRGKSMPAKKFATIEHSFIPVSIFFQTITGDYADGTSELLQIESDLVLKPDFTTATAAPWAADVTLQVIHDIEDRDGNPVGLAPRNVLKRVLGFFAAEGWRPVVAPEIEFYLTKPNVNPDHPIEPPVGRTGRHGVGRQAYSMSAVDEYGPVIDDIYDFVESHGFEIETIIQEGGAGQIEINLDHGCPLELADQVFYFKRTIREAALRNDCFATFMAKPMEHEPGSAMHIHQSVLDDRTGDNVFTDEKGDPTDLFLGFLAGQQTYLPAVMCILAPYVNSYRRFVAGSSAPINLEWGTDNRSTGLRVPISKPSGRRVENRVAGMDCNSYLAFAASLACGYLGMMARAKPRDAVSGDAYSMPRALPRGLWQALELFESQPEITRVLGPDFCRLFRKIKAREVEAFHQVISPWERQHLLLNV